MSKTTKIYSKLTVAVKIITVIAFIWILVSKRAFIEKINFETITTFNSTYFSLVLLLVPLNWFFEYLKWKKTLQSLAVYEKRESIEAFLSGIFSGFITPNFIGNFIGRILYYPFKTRPKIILFTLLANFSQFLTTISIGVIALLLIPSSNLFITNQMIGILVFLVVVSWILYFYFEHFKLYRIKLLAFFRHFELYQPNTRLKVDFISLNILRYLVFSVQYLVIINVFLSEFRWDLYGYITLIYFWSTLIPNFIWGKLFLRESVALIILLPIISNANIILVASLSLSIINQIIPAIVGIPFLMKKKKYE